MEYKVSKSTMERYDIRIKDSFAWAVITISEDGFFNVQSDYGSYNYAWGSFGDCFKSFLIDLGKNCAEYPMDYLYDKIHRRSSDVDTKLSLEEMKISLLEKRQQNDIDEDQAREAWDDIINIEESCDKHSQDAFYNEIHNSSALEEVFNPDQLWYYAVECIYFHPDYSCKAFCEKIMPIFAEILSKELETKQAAI